LRDEVYEPLGLAPSPTARGAAGRLRGKGFPVAIAALAFVAGVVAPARRDAPLQGEPVAAAKPQTAAQPAESPPAPSANVGGLPPLSGIASADQVEQASGVKVTRKGGAGPPAALIIDVQRALALAKLKAALDAQH
jgi:hypothetical protein